MPKIKVTVTEEREVAYLRAECGNPYWEDATVNGVVDEDGSRIPCRIGDNWCPVIRLDEGRILDWPQGTTADIHYKIVDDGRYELLDHNRNVVATRDGYVPKIMCPEENGYGDYVIMKVDGDGKIANWKVNLDAFQSQTDKDD